MTEPSWQLECRKLTKIFCDATKELRVLQEIDLQVKQGDQLAIIGRSGSGKTTLLQMLGGLDAPTSGEILINGNNFTKMPELKQAQFRNRQLGFIYQLHHLLPEFSAIENVAMPMLIAGEKPKRALAKAEKLLAEVNMLDRKEHLPGTLSGGERQRVAIARALIMDPSCVLADEPTGSLDSETADHAFNLIKRLSRERGTTFILVTHDLELANLMEKSYLLQDGILQQAV